MLLKLVNRDNGAVKVIEYQPCLWGPNATNMQDLGLPKTATQFEFERSLLPDLYVYLDSLIVYR